jgi:GT2 family glycosyltransferase
MSIQPSCRNFASLRNNLNMALGLPRLFPNSRFLSGEHMFYFSHDEVKRVDVLTGSFLMIRVKAIEEVGMFDEQFFMYGEEADWCKRFWAAGWEVVFYPDAQVIHLISGSSSKDPTYFYKVRLESKLIYWRKHHSRPSLIGIILIIKIRHLMRVLKGFIYYLLKPSERDKILPNLKANYGVLISRLKS